MKWSSVPFRSSLLQYHVRLLRIPTDIIRLPICPTRKSRAHAFFFPPSFTLLPGNLLYFLGSLRDILVLSLVPTPCTSQLTVLQPSDRQPCFQKRESSLSLASAKPKFRRKVKRVQRVPSLLLCGPRFARSQQISSAHLCHSQSV